MPLYLALIYSCNSVPELVSPSLCIFLAFIKIQDCFLDLKSESIEKFHKVSHLLLIPDFEI